MSLAKLEKLYRAILRALKPNGLVYMDEYVGPARTDWTDELIAHQRALYAGLPAALRRFETLSYPVMQDDPSEAIRSSDIEPQLQIGFRILARRPYGGTLLSLVIPFLHGNGVTDDLVRKLIEEEQRFLAAGGQSYYTLIVAAPKRGVARMIANVTYWLVPKLKRVRRELKRR